MSYQLYDVFKNKASAEKLAYQLRNEGYRISVKKIERGYGVYVGGFRKIAIRRRR